MLKLIKYELRGNLLIIAGICITVIVASLLLLTQRTSWGTSVTSVLSVLLSIATITIILISSLKLMSKYLHNDTGYLLFTLPQSGINILLSKLLTALIQITLVIAVTILGIWVSTSAPLNFSFLNNITFMGIIGVLFIYVWGIISFLAFIYFCMVIGKVALRNKMLGKIGSFIIFIMLTIGMGWLSTKLTYIFPQTINLNSSLFLKNVDLSVNISYSLFRINISNLIFNVLTFVTFFVGTAYMIDNKLDL